MAANTTELEKRSREAAGQPRANSDLKSHERPEIALADIENPEMKKLATRPPEKPTKKKRVIDWSKQGAAWFAMVRGDLDELPRVGMPELYERKCDAVYRYFYEEHSGRRRGVYAGW